MANLASLVNSGLTYVGKGATLNDLLNNSGTVQVAGTLAVTGGLTNTGLGLIEEENLGTAAHVNVTGNADNSGTVQTTFNSDPGNMLTVSGTFTNENGGNLNVNGTGDLADIMQLANGGTVSVASGASLEIGGNHASPPLGMDVFGDGTLAEQVLGASVYGTIGVNGAVDLLSGSTLNVALLNGFPPTNGEIFTHFVTFTAGSLSGTFTNVTPDWVVLYNNAGGFLDLEFEGGTTTPEPASMLFGILGLAVVLYRVRRRRQAA